MDMVELAARLRRLNPKVAAATERLARRVPALRSRLEREYDRMLAGMEAEVKPYRGNRPAFPRLPAKGLAREEVLAEIGSLAERERPRWHDGFASGAVYQGDDAHVEFLNRVY